VQAANLCTMLVLGLLVAENAKKMGLLTEKNCF